MGDDTTVRGISARLNGHKQKLVIGIPVAVIVGGALTLAQWSVRTAYAGGKERQQIENRICLVEKSCDTLAPEIRATTTRVDKLEVKLDMMLELLKAIQTDLRRRTNDAAR